ncbi:MAG: hypothetical protein AAF138_04335 [Planctomycetota bacterium]
MIAVLLATASAAPALAQASPPPAGPVLPAFPERAGEALVISAHDATGVVEMRLSNGVVVRARWALGRDPERLGGGFRLSAVFGGGLLAETAESRGFSDAAALGWASASIGAGDLGAELTSGEVRGLLSASGLTLRVQNLPASIRLEIEGREGASLEAAARLMSALVTRPTLDDNALAAWAAERSALRRAAPADTSARLRMEFDAATLPEGRWWVGPPGMEAIERATPEAVRAWLDTGLAAWPLEWTVVGEIDAMRAAHLLRSAAGAVTPRAEPAPERFALRRRGVRPAGPVERLATAREGPAVVAIGFHGAEGGDLSDAARLGEVRRLILAKMILDERLRAAFASLAEASAAEGFAGGRLAGDAAYDPQGGGMTTGLVWAVAVARPGGGRATADLMWAQVERLAREGPGAEELERAVERVLQARGPEGDSAWYWVRVLESSSLRGLSLDTLTQTERALSEATPAEIAQTLSAWSSPTRRFTVIVEPEG